MRDPGCLRFANLGCQASRQHQHFCTCFLTFFSQICSWLISFSPLLKHPYKMSIRWWYSLVWCGEWGEDIRTTLSHLYKENVCAQTGPFRGTSIFVTLCNLNVTPNYLLKLYTCFFFHISILTGHRARRKKESTNRGEKWIKIKYVDTQVWILRD